MISVIDLRAKGWPESSVDAAAAFYRDCVPEVREHAAKTGLAAEIAAHHPSPKKQFDAVFLVLLPADHTHSGWRLSAIQQLARECAPMRVNAVVAGIEEEYRSVVEYLANAPGVTGQMFEMAANWQESA